MVTFVRAPRDLSLPVEFIIRAIEQSDRESEICVEICGEPRRVTSKVTLGSYSASCRLEIRSLFGRTQICR